MSFRDFPNLPPHPQGREFDIFRERYTAQFGEGFHAESGPNGFTVSVKRQPSPPILLAKITAIGTTAGTYKATQVRADGSSPTTPIVWDGVAGNRPVINLVAGPPSDIDDIVRPVLGADENGEPYWWFVSHGPAFFAVTVTKTGGADGTGTTKATWTYTVTSLGGQELGTAVPVARPRPNGKMTAGGSYGQAFYDGTALKLWDAGEIETTDECA